jgi:hypothetical protein
VRSVSREDIPALVGRWEGRVDLNEGSYVFTHPVIFSIANENLEGRLDIYASKVRTHPFVGKTPAPEGVGYAKVEDGNLAILWEEYRWARLTFHKDKTWLKGELRWENGVGTLWLQKVN